MLLEISIIPQTSEELFYFVTKRIPYLCGFWRFANAYLMFNTQEGRISMKQKKQGRSFAGTVVNLLNTSLMVDANTTTCVGFYQPEAPKELSRFKKSK